jgi:hypothetical protein
VGAEPIPIDGTRVAWVSEQMRTLKALELVLQASLPRGHARMRRFYDAVGPHIAGRLHSQWRADVVYVALKPCEWSARAALAVIGVRADQIDRLYAPSTCETTAFARRDA